MNPKEVFEYVKELYGTEPDYPWKDTNAVLRYKENSKCEVYETDGKGKKNIERYRLFLAIKGYEIIH